ncbi:MAG: SpoIIE family protein phosphatase [Clostridia bacterium]|nr:SpoIIE family protein phosphatase [Clostridia bacterium]
MQDPRHCQSPPERMRSVCPAPDELCEDIRRAAGEFVRAGVAAESEARGTMEYEWVASLLRDAVKADRAAGKEDAELSAACKARLTQAGVPADAVSVIGRRKKQVIAVGVPTELSEETLTGLGRALEEICGGAMTVPQVTETEGVAVLRAVNRPRFCVSCATAGRAADPSQASGDTVRFFDDRSDRFRAVLSDGMGAGESARAASEICCAFAEKMLSAGGTTATLTRMLNSLLRTGTRERSATLDLLELDLLHGEAVFLKAGAAASYVKRGSQLFRIRSRTIPLGLMKAPDVERVRFRAEAGDVFLLFSDGVGQGAEDDAWLISALAADWGEETPADTAARLLALAREHSDGRDDMTVAIVRVLAAD